MAEIRVLRFADALERAQKSGQKLHLLLGNGFSRGLRDDIFSYRALFERADFKKLSPSARKAFDSLKTTDFEAVMRGLRIAAALLETYDPNRRDIGAQMRTDADGLKDVLAATIAQNHPERPGDITDAQFESCRNFLQPFKNIYTL